MLRDLVVSDIAICNRTDLNDARKCRLLLQIRQHWAIQTLIHFLLVNRCLLRLYLKRLLRHCVLVFVISLEWSLLPFFVLGLFLGLRSLAAYTLLDILFKSFLFGFFLMLQVRLRGAVGEFVVDRVQCLNARKELVAYGGCRLASSTSQSLQPYPFLIRLMHGMSLRQLRHVPPRLWLQLAQSSLAVVCIHARNKFGIAW